MTTASRVARAPLMQDISAQRLLNRQSGLTLIELLVALALSGFIAIAAVSSLVVARRGFTTIDASSQLRDNARFASEMIQRVVTQAGYINLANAVNARTQTIAVAGAPATAQPYIIGFNNALLPSGTIAPMASDTLNNTRTASAGGCSTGTDTACVNGSDVLVVRYQTPKSTDSAADNTMINCAGIAQTAASIDNGDFAISALHVQLSKGEPSLMCSYQASDGNWVNGGQPLIEGVESFQVLYGVDGVGPGVATPSSTTPKLIANRYLRADQMVVAGNVAATENNWRRVRSVRIGMVLRGPRNSSQEPTATSTYYPLGTAMGVTADVGTIFTPPADGRLRQTVTFTVYLRNDQSL